MRQLIPTMAEVEPLDTYLGGSRPAPVDRPWIVVGMISSLDGATSVRGRSGALGGPADKTVFRAVRALADVILVGAGTARAEGYGPVVLSEMASAKRRAAGRVDPVPRIAIVTASLDLDLETPLFTGSNRPPLVFTTEDADPARVRAVGAVSELRQHGRGRVDVVAAATSLRGDGAEVVVCEGGPSLNGALVDAGVVDELCLTLSPVLAGGGSSRIVAGSDADVVAGYELVSLLTEDGMLFGRWTRT